VCLLLWRAAGACLTREGDEQGEPGGGLALRGDEADVNPAQSKPLASTGDMGSERECAVNFLELSHPPWQRRLRTRPIARPWWVRSS
jgi:hypothetical protein